MLSDAEMEIRRTGIGASEAAAAIGLSPYKTPIDLWIEKTSTEPPNRDWYQPGKPAYFGTLIEDVIADTYAAIHNVSLRRTKTLVHPEYDFILATPDREIVGQQKLLECKASSPWRQDWGEENTDEIPTEYVVQCHQQMAVRGWIENGCDIAVFRSITDYREYHVPFDHEFWDIIVAKLKLFWDCVQNNERPDIMHVADVHSLYPVETQSQLLAHKGDIDEMRELIEVRETYKAIEKRKKKLEDELRIRLAEHGELIGEDGTVYATFKAPKPRNKVDHKAIVSAVIDLDVPEIHDIIEEHTEEHQSARRLLVKNNAFATQGA